jgi:hypothetical protein
MCDSQTARTPVVGDAADFRRLAMLLKTGRVPVRRKWQPNRYVLVHDEPLIGPYID